MSQSVREEMLPKMRQRYIKRGNKGKTALINEVCEQWDYSRKHVIKLLNAKAGWGGDPSKRRGRPARYGKEVEKVLRQLWKVSEQPCGKRLKVIIPLWLPYYEKEHGGLRKDIREQTLCISPAQIDRLLAPYKVKRGHCGTKPGSILKTQIPIRTDNWDVKSPGFLEADSVAHCGGSLSGNHIWSITYTDIFSGWTANRGVWNKGAHGVVEATESVESQLPFEILGFDCDNGSEFLNQHLIRYFQQRPKKVGFTRSRPYHKNDNAHVEQKNWTHVRQLFGYDRFGDPGVLTLMNEIYTDVWEPLNNFFKPCMKLLKKERHGSKIKKYYDNPQTPCDRLLQSTHISKEVKAELRRKRAALNPLLLSKILDKKLRILHDSLRSTRLTDSLNFASHAGSITPPNLSK